MKVGIIGAGFAADMHAASWKMIPEIELFGIADIDEEKANKLAEKHGTSAYPTDELIQKVDIVDVCVPTPFHKEYVIKSAKMGKHVFCEKPIARNLEDANEMVQAVESSGVKFMVGHVLRFFHEYAKIKEEIDSGRIGRPVMARLSRCSIFPVGWKRWHEDYAGSGGVVLDMGIHDLDFLRWCFGEVDRVYAKGLYEKKLAVPLDYALITLRFKNKAIAHVESSWAETSGFKTELEIVGTKGLIHHKSNDSSPLFISQRKTEEGEAGVIIPENPVIESPFTKELKYFLEIITKNREPDIVNVDDAIKALEICLAVIRSITTGEVVKL